MLQSLKRQHLLPPQQEGNDRQPLLGLSRIVPTPPAHARKTARDFDYHYYATFRAAAFPGRREGGLRLFLVAWEGHQADKKVK